MKSTHAHGLLWYETTFFEKLVTSYLKIASVVLALFGAIKIGSSLTQSKILLQIDPIFGYSNGTVIIAVGIIELYLALHLSLIRSAVNRMLILASLVASFTIYRLEIKISNHPAPCKCLGAAVDWFPWLARYESTITTSVLLFFGLSFLYLLVPLLRRITSLGGGTY